MLAALQSQLTACALICLRSQPCANAQIVVAGKTRCATCPLRQTAVAAASSDVARKCGCADGFHNASQQLSVCFDGGYDAGEYQAALAAHDTEINGGQLCEHCPTDALGQACFECATDTGTTIAAGYTIPQLISTDSRRSLQQIENPIQLAFRCHNDFDLAIIRCPADPPTPGQNPHEMGRRKSFRSILGGKLYRIPARIDLDRSRPPKTQLF